MGCHNRMRGFTGGIRWERLVKDSQLRKELFRRAIYGEQSGII